MEPDLVPQTPPQITQMPLGEFEGPLPVSLICRKHVCDAILLSSQLAKDCIDQESALLGGPIITSPYSLSLTMMLLSVLILNLLVEHSFSQPDTKRADTNIPLSPSPSLENLSHGTINSPFQAQVTVEIQVDGLDGSAVINITHGAGSDVAGLTSDSLTSGGFSPFPTKPVALTSQGIFSSVNPSSIVIPSTGYIVSTFPTQSAIPALIANSSQSCNTSALHLPLPTSATSANVSIFTGTGVPLSQGLFDPTVVLISGLSQLAVAFFL